jgi:hypothetical protein
MSRLRIFMSFDVDHDRDLHDRLVEQSQQPCSCFQITAGSEAGPMSQRWGVKVRRRISEADEVVVICGAHTGSSERVSAEVRMAQEARKPYLLLWGRRETMCTRPAGARPDDCMYRWTPESLADQIQLTARNAQPREIPAHCKRP